jgi:glycosyltransferase involved in cell wall biosynthesis
VGGYDYRKNVGSIIEAFARLRNDIIKDFQLILVGDIGQSQKDTLMTSAKKYSMQNQVIFPGFIPDHELSYLYRNAAALIYPSLYEGFGLTVLEAMANNCAVITSDNSSLGEVAKDFALTFDPTDVDEISKAMDRIITDKNLRETLKKNAVGYAKTYNWEITAQETIKVLQKSMHPKYIA